MTKEEIITLLQSAESSRIERTESTGNMDKFQEAICAFSNDMADTRKNGYLIIGAKDDGTPSGLKVDDDLLKKIAGIRSDGNILPIPMMNCERYEMEGGDLLIVEVQPSFSPPVRYRGRTFIRIGPRKAIATPDEERRLTEKRMSNMASFDALPCYHATLEDVDVEFIRSVYIPKAVDEEEVADDTRSIPQQMAALGLYDSRHDCPTNACIILFGKRPRQFIPGMYLQYVCFAGQEKDSEVVDDKVFQEGLAKMLPQLEAFIDYGIVRTRPISVSSLREQQQSNYPVDALRELVLNACMHRDYEAHMPIRFYQYPDRIALMNAGGLYGKARPENFPDVNDYRNPIIAQALKVLGYVNMFNRGISRVKRLFSDNGSKAPYFDITKMTVFEVTSYSAMESFDLQQETKLDVSAFTKLFTKLIPTYFQESEAQHLERLLLHLSVPQSANTLAQLMGCNSRTMRNRYLNKMIEAGVIEFEIPDKPTSRNQKYKLRSIL